MRILQVCPRYPPQIGGVETHVREISERLVDRGHEVTVHTADAGGGGQRRERRDGVEIRRHLGLAPSGAYHLAPGLMPAVRRSDADLVHAHNYHAFPLLFAAMAVRDKRYVATPHYHGRSANPSRNWLLSAYRPIGRWALKRADTIVAVSEWEHEHLFEDLGVKALVIPNGVAVERFADAELESRDRPYLLTVGRLEAYKGVQHVIQSLPALPDYELVIIGDGPYRNELQALAEEAGLADRVAFLGRVEENRLPGLYAGAAVYVTLSKFEAFGMTVAEALAAGTPCVVLNTGALAEWVGHDGVVGIDAVSRLAPAVRSANKLAPIQSHVPTWDDVVDKLMLHYRAA